MAEENDVGFDESNSTDNFVNNNKKPESENTFYNEEKERENQNLYGDSENINTDEINSTQEEEKGIIRRFIPDTGMFNEKNLKIMGFVLVAMIISFGVLPKFISDKKKKDKKADEIAVANPEAMKVDDINGKTADPNAMAEVNTPVDPNAPVNPNAVTDDQLPSYYSTNNGSGGSSGISNDDLPLDNIDMNDIRKNAKQAYDLSEVRGANTNTGSNYGDISNSSGIMDEINASSTNNNSGNVGKGTGRNTENKKRGIEFVSNKNNVENPVGQLAQNPASYSAQQPQLQQTLTQKSQDYDQNRQVSKQNFLNTQSGSFVSTKMLNRNYSRFELKTGHIIHGIMITGVNSDLPGQVLAQVSRNVYDSVTGKHLLIPMGTKIYGVYDSNVTYGQNRLLLVWQRLVFPNGFSLELENMQGVDLMGNSGFKGRVNNHFLKLLRSVLLSSAIATASGRLDSINVDVNTGNRSRVSIGTGASNASEKIQSIGERLVEKDLNRQPTIYVKKGYKFNIIVNKDLILVPYNQLRR